MQIFTLNETSAELNYVNYDSMPTMEIRRVKLVKGNDPKRKQKQH